MDMPLDDNVERLPNGQFGRLAYRLAANAAFQREQRRDAARKAHRADVVVRCGADAERAGVPAELAWSIFA